MTVRGGLPLSNTRTSLPQIKSKFDLEPNPFEQSFKGGSGLNPNDPNTQHHQPNLNSPSINHLLNNRHSESNLRSRRTQSSSPLTVNHHDYHLSPPLIRNTPDGNSFKVSLPGIATIASPSNALHDHQSRQSHSASPPTSSSSTSQPQLQPQPPTHPAHHSLTTPFGWTPFNGLGQDSLRSGPLSPALLNGPTARPNTLPPHTGLTPLIGLNGATTGPSGTFTPGTQALLAILSSASTTSPPLPLSTEASPVTATTGLELPTQPITSRSSPKTRNEVLRLSTSSSSSSSTLDHHPPPSTIRSSNPNHLLPPPLPPTIPPDDILTKASTPIISHAAQHSLLVSGGGKGDRSHPSPIKPAPILLDSSPVLVPGPYVMNRTDRAYEAPSTKLTKSPIQPPGSYPPYMFAPDPSSSSNPLYLLTTAASHDRFNHHQQMDDATVTAANALTGLGGGNGGSRNGSRYPSPAPTTNYIINTSQQPQQYNGMIKSPYNSNKKRSLNGNNNSNKKAGKRKKEIESMEDEDGFGSDMESDNGIGTSSLNQQHQEWDNNNNSKGSNGKVETEEEKRKNFLERNRQAALKCRQRKKAWLANLQTKVETLERENENLELTIIKLKEEVESVKSILISHHSDCRILVGRRDLSVGELVRGGISGIIGNQQQSQQQHPNGYGF